MNSENKNYQICWLQICPFAKYVVSAVLIKSLRMHRVPVLFVKKQNEAAVHLYESLFFEKLGDYVIAYY